MTTATTDYRAIVNDEWVFTSHAPPLTCTCAVGKVAHARFRARRGHSMPEPSVENRPLIAVLDDEPQLCKALARLLVAHGMSVATYTQASAFLAGCESNRPDCLLLDLHMPDINGFVILEQVVAWHLPVIVITGHDTPGNAARALGLGASAFLSKPVDELKLLDSIRAAITPAARLQAGGK